MCDIQLRESRSLSGRLTDRATAWAFPVITSLRVSERYHITSYLTQAYRQGASLGLLQETPVRLS